ncbi:SMI1/KNR4 family protein [Microbulbifer thermotolerans]|uniref:SMI1/KNR4 family protein n=1 Tax=Microbulbifer thermotolerans TaxID=252514 RepID=UPI0026732B93|nr:SMI1/KNR4 family protein [Microbulbifer thermotolerans]WKT60044.1 SMI1/KNR4 family protein [Microbulbifer thermotolerans]
MTYDQAIEQLKSWIAKSNGAAIHIGKNVHCEFHQFKVYSDEEIASAEKALSWRFPTEFRTFMKEIGNTCLFNDPQLGFGIDIFTLDKIIKTHEELKTMDEEEPITDLFCMIGVSNSMGDHIGFTMNREGPNNFDIYCHEYPVFEYVNVSTEINSWRTFKNWLIKVVETLGEEII